MTTIQMSEHALNAFEQDEVVIRGTERFDIVVHDVGNNSRNRGPDRRADHRRVVTDVVRAS